MQFVYHENASNATLVIEGETYRHLFKSRRQKAGSSLQVRNLKDENLYTYEILEVTRKEASLLLVDTQQLSKKPSFDFTLGWSVIDPKTIEKTLPMLNEIGVGTIAFVYADFSQKNFKLDFQRFEKIVINSCEQCGRSELMQFCIFNSVEEYFEKYPKSLVLDFGGLGIKEFEKPNAILIGCEGGFSRREKEVFSTRKIVGLNSSFVLKSQSAACAIASQILL